MALRTLVRNGKEVEVEPGTWGERRHLKAGWKPVEPEPVVEPASQEEADSYEPEPEPAEEEDSSNGDGR